MDARNARKKVPIVKITDSGSRQVSDRTSLPSATVVTRFDKKMRREHFLSAKMG